MATILRRIMPRFLQRFIERHARRVGRWMLAEEIEALRAEAAAIQEDVAATQTALHADVQEHAAALRADFQTEMHRLRLEIQAAYDSAQAMFRILDQANKRNEAEPLSSPALAETEESNHSGRQVESDRRDQ
jgi:hypothetical protein